MQKTAAFYGTFPGVIRPPRHYATVRSFIVQEIGIVNIASGNEAYAGTGRLGDVVRKYTTI
jgi:hypothetical protein